MAEWLIPVIVPAITGLFALAGGALGMLGMARFNPEYRRYLDERQQVECQHVPVEAHQIEAFCEKCGKTLSKEDVTRLRILQCEHIGFVDQFNEDEYRVYYLWTLCGRTFEVARANLS